MDHQQAINEIEESFGFVLSFITPWLFLILILIVSLIALNTNSWHILMAA